MIIIFTSFYNYFPILKTLTFLRQPAWLRSNADAATVVLILWRSAQVIPRTLGTDATQVRAVRFDAFIQSLLLGLNKSHTHDTTGQTLMGGHVDMVKSVQLNSRMFN